MALSRRCRLLQAAAIVVVMALPTAHAGDITKHAENPRKNGPTAAAPVGFELETMRALVRLLCESTSIQELEGMTVGLAEVRAKGVGPLRRRRGDRMAGAAHAGRRLAGPAGQGPGRLPGGDPLVSPDMVRAALRRDAGHICERRIS
jgi:hypothetical protein